VEHEINEIIRACDIAIKQNDFETLIDYYTDDAILVVKPGMIVQGKDKIKKAFIAIARYFENNIAPAQGEMIILETEDIALVLSQTILAADKKDSEYPMDRKATYVFRKNRKGQWLCAIDNSYGTDLLNSITQ
jgi:uncharacterized protein (TIGR02246 family)